MHLVKAKGISKDDKSSGVKSCGEWLDRQLIKNIYKTL